MSKSEDLTFSGPLEIFPQEGGWYFVRAPRQLAKPLEVMAERGLIAIHATIGTSTWATSLLPMGDGSHFVAVPAKVRKNESLQLGGEIEVTFTPRER